MKENKVVAVLGLGLFGASVAKTLAKNGVEVIAMDKNMDHVEEVSSHIINAVQGDFTKLENLEAAFVNKADIAIIATGEQLEVAITTIFHLKKLNIKTIIAKTKNKMYREVLIKVGADRVILPEVEIGIEIGSEIAHARIQDLLELDEDYHIVEIDVEKDWINKMLSELNLNEEQLNILGVKGEDDKRYSFLLNPSYRFKSGDRVVVLSGNVSINDNAINLENLDEN